MKRYDNIMQDNVHAPKTDNNIWLKDNKLYYYTNGKWQLIGGSSEEDKSLLESLKQEVEDLIGLSTSDAIDNLNEIKDFLAGFKDDEALKDWMNNYYTKKEIDAKVQPIPLEYIDSQFNTPPPQVELNNDVWFVSYEGAKMDCIRILNGSGLGFGLAEAKALVENAPSFMKHFNTYEAAQEYIDRVLQHRDDRYPDVIIELEIR